MEQCPASYSALPEQACIEKSATTAGAFQRHGDILMSARVILLLSLISCSITRARPNQARPLRIPGADRGTRLS